MPDLLNRTMEMQKRMWGEQFRAAEQDGELYIEGYFAVFGSIYQICPGASESIDPHAFDDTIGDDVRALINHDTTLVLGRTVVGTLELRVDAHGLWGRIKINRNDTDAMNLYQRVQRGDVSQCSFGFAILDERTEHKDNGDVHWTILKVKLYEVSPCTFPAYEETNVSARKREYDQITDARKVDALRANLKARLAKHGT